MSSFILINNSAILVFNNISLSTFFKKILYYYLVLLSWIIKIFIIKIYWINLVTMLQMFCLLKPNMLKEDILLQQIVVLLTPNKSKTNKSSNKYGRNSISRWLYLRNHITNRVFDLLQKLNISSSINSSITLNTFSLLTILFCKISSSTRLNSWLFSFLCYVVNVKKLIFFKNNKIYSCNMKT